MPLSPASLPRHLAICLFALAGNVGAGTLCSLHVFHRKSENASHIWHPNYNYAICLQAMNQRQITKLSTHQSNSST